MDDADKALVERLREHEKHSNQSSEPKSKRLLIQERIEAAAGIEAMADEIEALRKALAKALKLGEEFAAAYAGTRDEEIILAEVAAIRALAGKDAP